MRNIPTNRREIRPPEENLAHRKLRSLAPRARTCFPIPLTSANEECTGKVKNFTTSDTRNTNAGHTEAKKKAAGIGGPGTRSGSSGARNASSGGGHRRSGRGCSFVQDAVMNGEQRQLQPIRDADFVVHVAQVVLDHLFGGAELRGDLLILVALYDERDNAQLFRGETIAHPQADHIVFGELAGDGDVLDPGFSPRDLADALHQSGPGDVTVNDAVTADAEIAAGGLAGVGQDHESGL